MTSNVWILILSLFSFFFLFESKKFINSDPYLQTRSIARYQLRDNRVNPPQIEPSQTTTHHFTLFANNNNNQNANNQNNQNTVAVNITEELEILLKFFSATNGRYWMKKDYWNTSTSHCNWYGVKCKNYAVYSLNLDYNNLTGTLPSDLSDLTYLTSLTLNYNHLHGTIPHSYSALSLLQYLSLSGNSLSGELQTDFFFNMTSLYELNLGHNQFSGHMPTSIGNLTSLYLLAAPSNRFSSLPDSIGLLTKLKYLLIRSNTFNGEIPSSLSSLTFLQELDLGNNGFSGLIPSDIGSLSYLTFLALDLNQLSGNIPTSLGYCTRLTQLFLDSNHLSGTIPSSIGSLKSLKQLDFTSNELTGSIPKEIGSLSLDLLFLGQNYLEGTIPSELTNLPVYHLDLSHNLLNGTLPSNMFGQMLRTLYLHYNQLTGTIPDNLRAAPGLYDMDISHNQLSGTGEELAQLTRLPQLARLHLNHNNFYGEISSLPSLLTFLDLSYTKLKGTLIPAHLSQVDISHTKFDGCVVRSFLASPFIRHFTAHGLVCDELGTVEFFHPNLQSVSNMTGIECPQWLFPNNAELEVDVNFFDRAGCSCFLQENYWDQPSQSCVPCPEGLICSTQVHAAVHTVKANYYPARAGRYPIMSSPELVYSHLLPCHTTGVCNPEESSIFTCAEGYDSKSMLCAGCLKGHYKLAGQCIPCKMSFMWLIPIANIGVFVGLLWWVWHLSACPGVMTLQIVLFWFQLTWLLIGTKLLDLHWDSETSLSSFGFIQTVTTFRPWAVECIFPNFGFISFFWFSISLPIVLLVTPIVGGEILKLMSSWINIYLLPAYKLRLWYTCFWLVQVIYFPLTQKILEIFNCVENIQAGVHYLNASPDISCDSEEYNAMWWAALITIIIFLPFWPLWCLYTLLRNSDSPLLTGWDQYINPSLVDGLPTPGMDGFVASYLTRDSHPHHPAPWPLLPMRFLWGAARIHEVVDGRKEFSYIRYLWVTVVLGFRKLALAMVLSLAPFQSVFIPLSVVAILVASIFLHVFHLPYKLRLDNLLESFLLTEALIGFLGDLLASTGNFIGSAKTPVLVSHLIVIICLIAYGGSLMYAHLRKKSSCNPPEGKPLLKAQEHINTYH